MNNVHDFHNINITGDSIDSTAVPTPQSSSRIQEALIKMGNQPVDIKTSGKIKSRLCRRYAQGMRESWLTGTRQHHLPVKDLSERHKMLPSTLYFWPKNPSINNQLQTIEKSLTTEIIKNEHILEQALKNNLLIQKHVHNLTQQTVYVDKINQQHATEIKGYDVKKTAVNCGICSSLNLFKYYVMHTGGKLDFSRLATSNDYSYYVQQRYHTTYKLIKMLLAENEYLIQYLKNSNPPSVMRDRL
ncbi:hypothetical protein SJI19_12620 [Acerihabitans sp. TG2]|uniref:hypothetical protein n=1 Tax=Acerihabitans sp. TG2 TaxID=3096008 RepID=UPI002B23E81F|nr:hypothetical protein [Acerihabitans sp. TG2]MEA9391376.1 hypothetical protein [Acerihabitans sp. TG2]